MRKILVSILILLILSLSSIVSAADNRQQDNQQQDQEKQHQDQQRQNQQHQDQQHQDQQRQDQQRQDQQRQDQQRQNQQHQDQQRQNQQRQNQQRQDQQRQDQQRQDRQRQDQQRQDQRQNQQRQEQQRQNHYDWSHPVYHNDNWRRSVRRSDESLPFRWYEHHDRYYGERINDNEWADRFPGLQPYRWHGEDFWYRGYHVTDAILFYNDSDELVSVGFMNNGEFVFVRDDNESYENNDFFFLALLEMILK